MTTAPSPREVSFVVPVHDGEKTLEELVRRLDTAAGSAGWRHEILLVNDGSRDGSWSVIESLAALSPSVRGVDLVRRSGQHAATLAGVRLARYSRVVTLDDDLEQRPEDALSLLDELDRGRDLVYGMSPPALRGPVRAAASRLARGVFARTTNARQASSSFRAFRRELIAKAASQGTCWHTFDILLNRTAERIAALPVEKGTRRPSRHGWLSLLGIFWRGLGGLTLWPYRILVLSAFAATLTAPWWAKPGLGLPMVGLGFQFLLMFFLGEGLWRWRLESAGAPAFVVKRTCGGGTAP